MIAKTTTPWLGLSSIAVRQALLSTLVMLIAATLLAYTALVTIESSAREQLLRTIDTDIAGLVDGMANGGAAEVARRIADRTDLSAQTGASSWYLLAGPRGTRLAGNLPSLPAVDAAVSQAASIDVSGEPVLVRATRLRGGLALVVGRSLAPANALAARLRRTFLLATLVAVAVSLLAGVAAAARLRRRVDGLNHAFRRFEQGERGARVGSSTGSGNASTGSSIHGRDELAVLARHVDSYLDWVEQLLHAQRDISDNIAHELRTPLVHLDSKLLRAIDRAPDAATTADLHGARDDIRAIVSLFDALLDLAVAESRGHVPGSAAEFDLSELAAGITELYAASAEEAGLAFTARIAPDLTMPGEPMAIMRLIANVLDNAFKYVPAGAHVRLTVAEGPRITVEDNGPGIAVADRERIFERFYRAGRAGAGTGAGAGAGHGLGLALARVIAARHGLVSRVEDAGPGARFVFEPARQV